MQSSTLDGPAVRPLGSFGVEISGVDTMAIIERHSNLFRQAFQDHHLVILRDLQMNDDLGVRLTELLGNVSFESPHMKSGRKFSFISNVHKDGTLRDGELFFHSDHSFFSAPLKAISLYALAVPGKGGQTLFSDTGLAYARLPTRLKQRIANLQARHVASYGVFQGNSRPAHVEATPSGFSAIHPVVWRHPDTGREILFVSRLLTESIIGLDRSDSEALLEELFVFIEDPAYVYAHQWQVGDYVVWDNRALQHARKEFDPAEKRAMRRVPIQ